MPVIHLSVITVLKKFPEHRHVIQGLFKTSNAFLTLCEDYRRCKEALEYWNLSRLKQAPILKREYKVLLRELESEILKSVDDFHYQQERL